MKRELLDRIEIKVAKNGWVIFPKKWFDDASDFNPAEIFVFTDFNEMSKFLKNAVIPFEVREVPKRKAARS